MNDDDYENMLRDNNEQLKALVGKRITNVIADRDGTMTFEFDGASYMRTAAIEGCIALGLFERQTRPEGVTLQ